MNVLILSATASAINYLKALAGQEGISLFATDTSPLAAGLYLPGVRPLLVPPARRLGAYGQALDRIIARHEIDILIPTSDHDMAGVMKLLHEGWDPPVAMFKPGYRTYRTLADKGRLTAALAQKGFPVPRLWEDGQAINFPVIIKPANEGGGKGVFLARDEKEFAMHKAAVEALFPGAPPIVQEYIPGGKGSIHVALLLYGRDGRIYGQAASQSKVTFMSWGGGGNAGYLVDAPGLLELAREMVASLGGWQGPLNLEFKRSQRDNRYYLMEANCRLNGYSYLTTMNDMNFPRAIVELLTSGRCEPLFPPPPLERKNFILGFRESSVSSWVNQSGNLDD